LLIKGVFWHMTICRSMAGGIGPYRIFLAGVGCWPCTFVKGFRGTHVTVSRLVDMLALALSMRPRIQLK
jgi:hypothetical protein